MCYNLGVLKKVNLILLILILSLAAFLRLYKLTADPPSLFGDELDLGYQAYSILKTGRDYRGNFMPLNFQSIAEFRTPLYLYSAVPTVAVFGITPLGVRLPAAFFGILGVLALYLLSNELISKKFGSWHLSFGILPAALLAISPWHLQYSRAGFEVTEMLFFLLLGLWLFFKSLNNGKFLWLSVISFLLTPLTYSTAKFFTPILIIFLFIFFRKEILSMTGKNLVRAIAAGLIVGIPVIYGTLFGGGTARFNYISVFADPTTEANIGASRELMARIRGEKGAGLSPSLTDKLTYNKFTYWGDLIIKNYFGAFSTTFLFTKGDPDPRQSTGTGEFYKIEIIALIIGIIFFFTNKEIDKKIKYLVGFWTVLAPAASSLTIDGANHATRLIILLPPLIFLIAYGTLRIFESKKIFFLIFSGILILEFAFYLSDYYGPYPWRSERWWHYGWGPAVSEIKKIDSNYDRVIISMSAEPAWIFFAGYYQFDPKIWQKEFPIGRDKEVSGFGKISYIRKFYFGSPDKSVQIYGLGRYIDSKTLYLANASEVGENLIANPDKVPPGLKLIKAVAFPSGEPSMYLFSGVSPK